MGTAPQRRGLRISASLLVLGGAVQVFTSLVAPNILQVYYKMPDYTVTVGDVVYNCGQVGGQMCWIYALCLVFKLFRGWEPFVIVGEIFSWLFLNIGFFDLLDIVFLNPYEHSTPKYVVFSVSVLITLMIFSKWITNRQKRRNSG